MDNKFTYILENLTITPNIFGALLGLLFGIVFLVIMRYLFLYSYGYKLLLIEAKELKKKKDTLSDLILMKDIQTELEKEIEQAMLKATFQG